MWKTNSDSNSGAFGPERSLGSGGEITLSFSYTEYFWFTTKLPDFLHLYQFLPLLICFFAMLSVGSPLICPAVCAFVSVYVTEIHTRVCTSESFSRISVYWLIWSHGEAGMEDRSVYVCNRTRAACLPGHTFSCVSGGQRYFRGSFQPLNLDQQEFLVPWCQ